MNKKVKRLKGISLIVLVITILVLSILAATVIISLSNTNIIGETNKAVLKSNIQSLQDRVTSYTADNYASIDMEKEYTLSEYGITEEEFKKYQTIAVVKGGKIYIKPNADSDILEVARELNVLLDGTISNTGSLELASTNVKSLRIYGNSIQNGTPSESTPVEIQSVGEKAKNLACITGKEIVNATLINEKNGVVRVKGNDGAAAVMYSAGEARFSFKKMATTNKKITISFYMTRYTDGIWKDSSDDVFQLLFYENVNYSGFQYIGSYFENYEDYPINERILVKATIAPTFDIGSMVIRLNGIEWEIEYDTIQIEEGDTATDYEPYGYNIPVRTSGKNLLNIPQNFEWSGTYTYDCDIPAGTYTLDLSSVVSGGESTPYIRFSNNQKGYYLSSNNSNFTIILETRETKIYVYSNGYNFSASEGITSSIKDLMLEKGETTTEYEPYNATTYNIYLREPLRKLGSTADYIDCTAGEVVRYIKVKDTTGTKSIEESFEVLTTPTTEKVSVSDIDYTNKKYVSVDTTVIPSSIEVRY